MTNGCVQFFIIYLFILQSITQVPQVNQRFSMSSPCFRTLFFSFLSKIIFFSGSRVSFSKGFGPELPKTYLNTKATKATQMTTTAIHMLTEKTAKHRESRTALHLTSPALSSVFTQITSLTDI